MKRIGQALFILILTTSVLFADDPPRVTPQQLILFPQGFTFNGGLGFSGLTTSTIWNISAANPASLADFQQISAGVSMQYASRIDDIFGFDIAYERVNPYVPQSLGLALLYGRFRFGLGFRQKYNHSLDVGELPIRTMNNPQGTGETYHPIKENYIYSGSGLISYSLPRFINPDHGLAFGVQIDLDFLRNYEEILGLSATAADRAISWKAGIRYRFLELLKLGVTFEKGAHFDGVTELQGRELLQPPDSGFVSRPVEYEFTADLPDRLGFGLWLRLSDKFSLANDFSYVYWEQMYYDMKNQFDISGSVYFLASPKLRLSAGFFSTRRELQDADNPRNDEAFFISAGLLARFGRFDLETVLADSHWLSSDTRKQTLARLGLGVSL